jgi:hypothetical protein
MLRVRNIQEKAPPTFRLLIYVLGYSTPRLDKPRHTVGWVSGHLDILDSVNEGSLTRAFIFLEYRMTKKLRPPLL